MRLTVRSVATALALVFALYFAARALWWTSLPARPPLVLLSVLIFLVTLPAIIVIGPGQRVLMSRWAAAAAWIAAVAIPELTNLGLERSRCARRTPPGTSVRSD